MEDIIPRQNDASRPKPQGCLLTEDSGTEKLLLDTDYWNIRSLTLLTIATWNVCSLNTAELEFVKG